VEAANIIISKPTRTNERVPRFATFARKRGRWGELPMWVVLSDKRFRANRHGRRLSLGAQLIWNHIAHYEKTPLTRRPAK
jgi:hypothetical protein